MKIIVLGGDGMLGHMLARRFASLGHVLSSSREPVPSKDKFFLNINPSEDVESRLREVLRDFSPDLVFNCIGYIKQREKVKESFELFVNSWFPHLLNDLSNEFEYKLVHFSTDCVFSGRKGDYSISDSPDPVDLYGMSKLAGEVFGERALTIRTSIIGHELRHKKSLLDWFMSQEGKCSGFTKAIYSGVTTFQLASLLINDIVPAFLQNKISGIYHLSSSKISKYDLLVLISKIYKKEITIERVDFPVIDRSLDSRELCKELGIEVPSWSEMICEMQEDFTKQFDLYKETL